MDIRTFCRDVAQAYAKQNQKRELILVDDSNPELLELKQTLYSVRCQGTKSASFRKAERVIDQTSHAPHTKLREY